jgi:hypothetical protein
MIVPRPQVVSVGKLSKLDIEALMRVNALVDLLNQLPEDLQVRATKAPPKNNAAELHQRRLRSRAS